MTYNTIFIKNKSPEAQIPEICITILQFSVDVRENLII